MLLNIFWGLIMSFERAKELLAKSEIVESMLTKELITKNEEELLFSIYPVEGYHELKYRSLAFIHAMKSEKVALALLNFPEGFSLFSDTQKADLARRYFFIMENMIKNNMLNVINSEALSYIVASYSLLSDSQYQKRSSAECKRVTLAIAQDDQLVQKLHPAARHLLFSWIKQQELFNSVETRYTLGLSEKTIQAIILSQVLPIHENAIVFWILSLCGINGADYVGRFHSMLDTAMCNLGLNQQPLKVEQNDSDKTQAEVLALSLVEDPVFITGYPNDHFPEHPLALLSVENRYALGLKHSSVAELMYELSDSNFSRFSDVQKAKLVIKQRRLFLKMISDEKLRAEDLNWLFNFTSHETRYLSPACCVAVSDEDIAHYLYERKYLFEKFSDDEKAEIASVHHRLAMKMMDDGVLTSLNYRALTFLVGSYAVLGGYHSHDKTPEQRNEMLIAFFKHPALANKILPIARILAFSWLQKSLDFRQDHFNLSDDTVVDILSSYNLPIQNEDLCFWLITLCGLNDLIDTVGRFDAIYRTAVGEYGLDQQLLQGAQSQADRFQAEVLALTIIHDPRFINGFDNKYSPLHPHAKLTTEMRIELGRKYPAVAIQLLRNKVLQGSRAFTPEEALALAVLHHEDPQIALYARFYQGIVDAKNQHTTNSTILCNLFEERQALERFQTPSYSPVPSLRTLTLFFLLRSTKVCKDLEEDKKDMNKHRDDFGL